MAKKGLPNAWLVVEIGHLRQSDHSGLKRVVRSVPWLTGDPSLWHIAPKH